MIKETKDILNLRRFLKTQVEQKEEERKLECEKNRIYIDQVLRSDEEAKKEEAEKQKRQKEMEMTN